jgi:hypothetical protein
MGAVGDDSSCDVALLDYHHRLTLSAAIGPGTMAMSECIRFPVSSRVLAHTCEGLLDCARYRSRLGETTCEATGVEWHEVPGWARREEVILPHGRW